MSMKCISNKHLTSARVCFGIPFAFVQKSKDILNLGAVSRNPERSIFRFYYDRVNKMSFVLRKQFHIA